MDLFDGPYYRTNKFLLTLLGQWPYQNPIHKRIIRTVIVLLIVSINIPAGLYLVEQWGENLNETIECAGFLGMQIAIVIKWINYITKEDKIRLLTDRIYNDWKHNFNDHQLEILKEFSEKGRILTKIYATCIFSELAAYVAMPWVPKFLDIALPLNESRPLEFPVPAKYGDVDPNQWFYLITLHGDAVVTFGITTVVAMDTTYNVYAQHACGLFATVGDQMKRLLHDNDDDGEVMLETERQEEITYRTVCSCIKLHNDAIDFSEAIEEVHYGIFFFVVGFIVICTSMAGYQMIDNLDNPPDAIRYFTLCIAHVAHIFYLSLPGQKLMDISEGMGDWVYSAQWYRASPRTKKLIRVMLQRSSVPCQLTAGKLFVMSMENVSLVVRTSVSYFTMLTSFREQ